MERYTECETVLVSIADKEGRIVTRVMPSFTVKEEVLHKRIAALRDVYLASSAELGEPVSLGDFALYLIAKASLDPRRVPLN